MYPRTTFYGFGSTTATCSPSHGRRRLPWPPSFEGQLVPLANHIVQLRRRPEFTAINQTADRLLRPAQSNSLPVEEVVALIR